jgi:hypothetical protein
MEVPRNVYDIWTHTILDLKRYTDDELGILWRYVQCLNKFTWCLEEYAEMDGGYLLHSVFKLRWWISQMCSQTWIYEGYSESNLHLF